VASSALAASLTETLVETRGAASELGFELAASDVLQEQLREARAEASAWRESAVSARAEVAFMAAELARAERIVAQETPLVMRTVVHPPAGH
jgi:hypothetical protein